MNKTSNYLNFVDSNWCSTGCIESLDEILACHTSAMNDTALIMSCMSVSLKNTNI